MTRNYSCLSIAQLSTLIQAGTLDPVDLAGQVFEAIEAHGDDAIFISLTRDRAMAEARAASKRIGEGRSLGLLDGVPIAWKDLFDMAGETTAAAGDEDACVGALAPGASSRDSGTSNARAKWSESRTAVLAFFTGEKRLVITTTN